MSCWRRSSLSRRYWPSTRQLSEKLGRLDAPTIEALRSTRLLRFACPRELGGLEVDPVTLVEVYEALARIDASISWGLGILAGTSTIAGAFLPAASARRIFAKGVPPMAGMVRPKRLHRNRCLRSA
jgi:indole-3-acetate monooxygenase